MTDRRLASSAPMPGMAPGMAPGLARDLARDLALGGTMATAADGIHARAPYQHTEAFRFGNPIVDEWEEEVNAWPLDEGPIDYVDASFYGTTSDANPAYSANVISTPQLKLGGATIDASWITPELLKDMQHEAGGIEASVATGYRAIEFLSWGRDLNGTAAGAGNRPATDNDTEDCTGGHCDRCAAYLQVATGRRRRRSKRSLLPSGLTPSLSKAPTAWTTHRQ